MSDQGLIVGQSRISHHTLTTPGMSFSVPLQENFTLVGWTPQNLVLSEIGVNEGDNTAFIRIGDNINQFSFSTTHSNTGDCVDCCDELMDGLVYLDNHLSTIENENEKCCDHILTELELIEEKLKPIIVYRDRIVIQYKVINTNTTTTIYVDVCGPKPPTTTTLTTVYVSSQAPTTNGWFEANGRWYYRSGSNVYRDWEWNQKVGRTTYTVYLTNGPVEENGPSGFWDDKPVVYNLKPEKKLKLITENRYIKIGHNRKQEPKKPLTTSEYMNKFKGIDNTKYNTKLTYSNRVLVNKINN
jgi:hypothetical protein